MVGRMPRVAEVSRSRRGWLTIYRPGHATATRHPASPIGLRAAHAPHVQIGDVKHQDATTTHRRIISRSPTAPNRDGILSPPEDEGPEPPAAPPDPGPDSPPATRGPETMTSVARSGRGRVATAARRSPPWTCPNACSSNTTSHEKVPVAARCPSHRPVPRWRPRPRRSQIAGARRRAHRRSSLISARASESSHCAWTSARWSVAATACAS